MRHEFWTFDGWQLQQAMAERQLTAVELTALSLERIARHNPRLRAILSMNPHALATAEALDRERQHGRLRGPLHGLPIVLKDNIDVGDGTCTTAGSIALAQHRAAKDAFLVGKLRQAGAVIVGKANLTEWANFVAEDMPNGFSALGGQTKNPYGADLDTGGSSSGTGSAVAAGFAVMGVGTETSGSILSPSSEHALVGIKPTVGLISRSGLIPIAHSQDTPGPMARSVRDAAAMLTAMVGEDPEDPATHSTGEAASDDYTRFISEQALTGARIGLVRDPFWNRLSDAERAVMDAAVDLLQELGAQLVEDLPYPPASASADMDVLFYEFCPAIARYLRTVEPHLGLRTLEDLVQFNYDNRPQTIPYGQDLFVKSLQMGGLEEPGYLQARIRDLAYAREWGLDRLFGEHSLDAVAFPANYGAMVPAKAGYPSITVPAGCAADSGRPIGLTLTGPAFSEQRLISLAYSFEHAAPRRQAPTLREED